MVGVLVKVFKILVVFVSVTLGVNVFVLVCVCVAVSVGVTVEVSVEVGVGEFVEVTEGIIALLTYTIPLTAEGIINSPSAPANWGFSRVMEELPVVVARNTRLSRIPSPDATGVASCVETRCNLPGVFSLTMVARFFK